MKYGFRRILAQSQLVKAINSFDESKQRRCVNQNSVGGSIVAKPPIHSTNASGAPNNLNFRIPGGLRATRRGLGQGVHSDAGRFETPSSLIKTHKREDAGSASENVSACQPKQ
jgi:hypothetical protein